MKRKSLYIVLVFISILTARAQDETVNGNLKITGNIDATGSNKRIYLGGVSASTFGISYSNQYPNYGIFYTEGSPDYVSISPNGNANNGILNVYGDGNIKASGNLNVNKNAFLGNLNERNYLSIISKEWPEVRFQTPTSDRQIRLGVAHSDDSGYNVNSGDFYVYTQTSNTMPLVVQKQGDVKIGSIKRRSYLNVVSKEWPEVRFQTPTSDRQIRLGVAHADNSGYGIGSGDFYVYTQTSNTMPLIVSKSGSISLANKSGNVGIGTRNPDMKLTVNGKIHAKEVKIDLNIPAPDYVFKKNYNLRSIDEVAKFIERNNHLPEIPSAMEFEQNGIMQAEMDMNLLKKIEELTLYTIQQEKKIKELESLNTKFIELQKRLEKLEKE